MRKDRPSKWATAMEVAEAVAKRSHDEETAVGAVLVKNDTGAIIATGCNGFVRGAPDDKLPATRPDKYQFMVHAEQNLIANCARHGISMDDCTLVCTLTPCVSCMRLLYQCGITRVIASKAYKDFDDIRDMGDIECDVMPIAEGLEITYNKVDPNKIIPKRKPKDDTEALKAKIQRLEADLQSVYAWRSDWNRCEVCGHLYVQGYVCYCGHDNTSFDCQCSSCQHDADRDNSVEFEKE